MTQEHDDIDIEFQQAPPDKLYAHNRRQLSAMLDGELSPDQARFMLRRLRHDTELAACWERWQVCGDLLRGRGHALLPADFSQRVAAAIAVPANAAATAGIASASASASASSGQPRHRLLRWGGGALAASVALVALFMARQMPGAQAPEPVEAAGVMRAAPALVERAPTDALADAGDVVVATTGEQAPASPDGDSAVPGLLAAAASTTVAVAEVPRRSSERGSTRSQAQRAAVRRSQSIPESPARVAVVTAPRVAPAVATPAARPLLEASAGSLPGGLAVVPAAADGDALFGALPAAPSRPWPRAVLPGLTPTQPFAAGFGQLQGDADAFAPFQPRLDRDAAIPAEQDAAPAADAPARDAADEAAVGAPPGAQPGMDVSR